MRSSNPVMNSLTKSQGTSTNPFGNNNPYDAGQNVNSFGQQGYGQSAGQTSERPMTVDDVVTKTGITLAVLIVFAIANFFIGTQVNYGAAILLTVVGGLGSFIVTLIAAFSKKFGSAPLTLTYAVLDGFFVGGFSLLFAGVNVAGSDGMALIGQAIMGTVGVFIGMLVIYKTGAVKVTPKFNKIMFGLIAGVAVLALGNFIGAIFFGFSPLRDGGAIAIIFSLVCIVLAAMSFLTDFDHADRLIRLGAPSKTAWGVALGLTVTLVWLYTEILRLLSYFQDR
ncbi:Bax inhibitor-1/YccA family protein [Corynebacterium striatum]|uniref:Bax inhibitor-1/YccA family protein n=1 Tax=Corynebacterium striatum TaxID=43770 RepID=UPI001A210D2A|nr:Bax inhibitor-1/YccA family protein [Corynebacterium striatum]EGT5592778.1 hypothetical protein [Corynebacterium striatum]MDK8812189.1 Bax inhibitor-1/YccA family protein [Corynebacterium striatum]HAT1549204.1 hypothetical protein [Corynebacterium striatum]